ncbi:MAG: hypothetical protein AAGI50_00145 [Pseudomonadota bacterium]
MTIFTQTHRSPAETFGPYSPWPRRSKKRAVLWVGSGVAAFGVFVHCVLPMLVA